MPVKVIESSTERNHWSARNPIWRKYRVSKPRIPTDEDKQRQWIDAHVPDTLLGFVSPSAVAAHRLRGVIDGFKLRHTAPSILLEGPSGSGKTSLIKCFLSELQATFGASGRQRYGVLVISAKTAAPSTIEQAVDDMIASKSGFKLVVVDEIDQVPTVTQQALRKAVAQSKQTKLLFSCVSASKVIAQFREKCNRIALQLPPEREALTVVLQMLKAERVGFERQGIQLLFQRAKEMNLSKMMPLLQDIFIADYFLSEINMQRRLLEGKKRKKPTIMSHSALPEPFSRCDKCTLIPPCQHISWDDLHRMGMDIRSRLPRYKGGMACQEFVKTGRCTMFLTHGHCSLDHPSNYHIVLEPIRRCPSCTLPYPCNHCNYSLERKKLQSYVNACKDALRYLDMKSLQLTLQADRSVSQSTIADRRAQHRSPNSLVQAQRSEYLELNSHFGEFSHLQQLVDETSHAATSEQMDAATHSSHRTRAPGSRVPSRTGNRQQRPAATQDGFSKDLLISLRVADALHQLHQVEEWLIGEMITDVDAYVAETAMLQGLFEPILEFISTMSDKDSIGVSSPVEGRKSQTASWVESFS